MLWLGYFFLFEIIKHFLHAADINPFTETISEEVAWGFEHSIS
jgi:hypothetical protein